MNGDQDDLTFKDKVAIRILAKGLRQVITLLTWFANLTKRRHKDPHLQEMADELLDGMADRLRDVEEMERMIQ